MIFFFTFETLRDTTTLDQCGFERNCKLGRHIPQILALENHYPMQFSDIPRKLNVSFFLAWLTLTHNPFSTFKIKKGWLIVCHKSNLNITVGTIVYVLELDMTCWLIESGFSDPRLAKKVLKGIVTGYMTILAFELRTV